MSGHVGPPPLDADARPPLAVEPDVTGWRQCPNCQFDMPPDGFTECLRCGAPLEVRG